MLAQPWLCRSGKRVVILQVWDPPMAGDVCWGLHHVWDCRDETAKEGGIISSITVGRKGGPEQAPWCCRAPCPFCRHPLSRGS